MLCIHENETLKAASGIDTHPPLCCRGMGSANSVRLYTMHASDTGMSRMLLWWIWKIGVNAINDIFYPAAVKPVSAVAKASTKVKTMFDGEVYHHPMPPLHSAEPWYQQYKLSVL